jgi:hypothetical protein
MAVKIVRWTVNSHRNIDDVNAGGMATWSIAVLVTPQAALISDEIQVMAAVRLVKNSVKKLIAIKRLNFIALPKNANQNRTSGSYHLIFAIRSRYSLHLKEDSSPDVWSWLRIIVCTLILFSDSSWSLTLMSKTYERRWWIRIVGMQNEKTAILQTWSTVGIHFKYILFIFSWWYEMYHSMCYYPNRGDGLALSSDGSSISGQ